MRFIGKRDIQKETRISKRNAFSRGIKSRRISRDRVWIGARENPSRSRIVEKFRVPRFSARRGVGVYRVAAGGFSVCGSRRATHPWPARTPTSPYGSDAQHVTRGTPGRAVDIGGGGAREAARSGT